MKLLEKLAPTVSATEREALAAGTVGIEAELFRGRVSVGEALALPWPELSERERDFLTGPVREIAAMVDPWATKNSGELPDLVWQRLREELFFGLAIPVEWGGLGFSPLGQSAVFAALAARSLALSAVVLIPNSVGPGELLLEHGTDEQRRYWLPRLARGEELPCFALTEPRAGSDAASIEARGVVVRSADGGLALRLDFSKRYITLGPIATVIGLAVRVFDPDHLLATPSSTESRVPSPESQPTSDLGITVVLVPAATPGVVQGAWHDPMGVPLPNGPISGSGVVVDLDSAVIGGRAGIGKGWGMLMEALSAGRGISLPAQSVGGARHLARVAGAYTTVRRQFGQPIARFEGIAERLARIAGTTWMLDAGRKLACGAIAAGERPAVLSATLKVESTERMRQIAADTMDVMGGAALCLGPRNLVADAWFAAPIGITVEGANILTRTLIVFGQGAIRCHPAALAELAALESGKLSRVLAALARHLTFSLGAAIRLGLAEVSRGALVVRRGPAGPTARWWRRLGWSAARFAVCADLALVLVGPQLKRRGRLSGAFADWLGAHVLLLASLRRFEAEGRRTTDLDVVEWASESLLADAQRAAEVVIAELVPRPLRGLAGAWARVWRVGGGPSRAAIERAAASLGRLDDLRERLVADDVAAPGAGSPLAQLELAFAAALAGGPAGSALRRAEQSHPPPAAATLRDRLDLAIARGELSRADADAVEMMQALADQVLAVDSREPRAGRPEPQLDSELVAH